MNTTHVTRAPHKGAHPVQMVELVAAAYEWLCPNCDHRNVESFVPASKQVSCTGCNTIFKVRKHYHAVI